MTQDGYSGCVCGAGKQHMLFALQWIHKWKLHCASIWRAGDGVCRETKEIVALLLSDDAVLLTHPGFHRNNASGHLHFLNMYAYTLNTRLEKNMFFWSTQVLNSVLYLYIFIVLQFIVIHTAWPMNRDAHCVTSSLPIPRLNVFACEEEKKRKVCYVWSWAGITAPAFLPICELWSPDPARLGITFLA